MPRAIRSIPISECSGVRVFSAWLLPDQNGAIPVFRSRRDERMVKGYEMDSSTLDA